MIAIIDYGMGNLRSVQKAFEKVGAGALITQSQKDVENAKKLVLPGVGAIQPAMEKLKMLNLIEPIKKSITNKVPFLGICLGYQLLFEKSQEGKKDVAGLGIIKGTVEIFDFSKINDPSLKIPHMGWNQLKITKNNCPLYNGIDSLSNVYFCHSYFPNPVNKDIISGITDHGIDFASSIWKDNIFGVQFHPEKSQKVGLQILKNFAETKI